ncbi:Copper-transporting ATPase HMA4 [Camellia lanceoleosa]|uniref:Copper-transporting ATPase HMA4 n=1 Tax=Camellia lanceoleosa TaxID=1840588 RepID=A0ACC0H0Y0_9ERIC|nr:Copper-transporting ATPase HMA4 [Camellia lanceoleosa]
MKDWPNLHIYPLGELLFDRFEVLGHRLRETPPLFGQCNGDLLYFLRKIFGSNVISEIEISTQLLQRNDIFNIVPKAKVPVDGIVINGQSHVNESMITGESKPIAKRPGDKVIGGTPMDECNPLYDTIHMPFYSEYTNLTK